MHGTAWELERVRGNAVMSMLTLSIISVVASLGVFGKDRVVFWRESAAGEPRKKQSPALLIHVTVVYLDSIPTWTLTGNL